MNVRAMKCMCAQTRPRFILSSERVLGGMVFEPMLTPREKSPLPENFPRGGSNPRRCGQRAQTLPTSYSGPSTRQFNRDNLARPLRTAHLFGRPIYVGSASCNPKINDDSQTFIRGKPHNCPTLVVAVRPVVTCYI